jgi:hypothetical protein
MKTDLSPSNTDFIPGYSGWENDFDERCRQQNRITVKLQSADQPAGVEEAIKERATKNGFKLALDHADTEKILVFEKAIQGTPAQR